MKRRSLFVVVVVVMPHEVIRNRVPLWLSERAQRHSIQSWFQNCR